jgi:hypothetical protein
VPRVCVWMLRASLLYLGAGFTLGALMLTSKGLGVLPAVWNWLPVHMEWLLVGWFVQLVMGVAYWIFPRFGLTPAARGRESLAWVAFGLLNAGIWMVCGSDLLAWPIAGLGRVAELAAAGVMALNVWARTRASGITGM